MVQLLRPLLRRLRQLLARRARRLLRRRLRRQHRQRRLHRQRRQPVAVAAIAAAVTGMVHPPLCAVKAAADGAGTMEDAVEVVYVRVAVLLSSFSKAAEYNFSGFVVENKVGRPLS